jgi:oxygen-independent coproporphyrinogen-3 oxidase
VRWWNVKHPRAYDERLAAGNSPALAREVLDASTRELERVLLEVRVIDGLALDPLPQTARTDCESLVGEGLVESHALASGRVVLTLQGRLLADLVVRRLVEHERSGNAEM